MPSPDFGEMGCLGAIIMVLLMIALTFALIYVIGGDMIWALIGP